MSPYRYKKGWNCLSKKTNYLLYLPTPFFFEDFQGGLKSDEVQVQQQTQSTNKPPPTIKTKEQKSLFRPKLKDIYIYINTMLSRSLRSSRQLSKQITQASSRRCQSTRVCYNNNTNSNSGRLLACRTNTTISTINTNSNNTLTPLINTTPLSKRTMSTFATFKVPAVQNEPNVSFLFLFSFFFFFFHSYLHFRNDVLNSSLSFFTVCPLIIEKADELNN